MQSIVDDVPIPVPTAIGDLTPGDWGRLVLNGKHVRMIGANAGQIVLYVLEDNGTASMVPSTQVYARNASIVFTASA